jgi:hypothetical protein
LVALTVVIAMFCAALQPPQFPVISLIVPVILASFQDFTWFFKGFLDFTAPHLQGFAGVGAQDLRAGALRPPERARVIGMESLANNLRMQFCEIGVFHRPSPESFTYKNRKL